MSIILSANALTAVPPGKLSDARVIAPGTSSGQTAQGASVTNDDSENFPVRIHHVPGRGRGFFADRDFTRGDEVFQAMPLACAISEDWVGNTCAWCFKFDDRRKHHLKVSAPGGTKHHQACHYKGAFCSEQCQENAIASHGSRHAWQRYVAVLDSIEAEAQRLKATASKGMTKAAKGKKPKSCEASLVFSEGKSLTDDVFNPDDASDDQLAQWIMLVWDSIIEDRIFIGGLPDSPYREIARLIAGALCHRSNKRSNSNSKPVCSSDPTMWAADMVRRSVAAEPVAPWESLEHMQPNEVNWLRSELYSLQLTRSSEGGDVSNPATIAPIHLPLVPTAAQIRLTGWGALFRVAAETFWLLNGAWQQAIEAQQLPALEHADFRDVYYREMANSFGIWDPNDPFPSENPADDQRDGEEHEMLGFAIYPTAVYFNHSCAPNVFKAREGRQIRFVCLHDIRQGEEMFISYGSVFEDVGERRERLQQHYFFVCTCDRCVAESTAYLAQDGC
ncbi:SET domain-containing protein [Linderina pennispora]|uniref:SET domain-containing protein n=1 Tax=Linderina pennispora TaxID=61395 RepID=A0A1Y1WKT2_9FUNG|nr:SET domain-containing protein [Linderina pennispora]ORX74191.1 SET domain-containing protein [Linderina pennispora]